MNKKVLTTMVVLMSVFLVSCYVIKIFFPEQFVIAVENPTLISIGEYINNHAWADYLFGIATAFITYWLYLCAICHRWYLKWWECLIVLGVIGASIGLTFVDINLYTAFSIISFIVLPALFGGDIKTLAIVFSIHTINQNFTLSIRNLIAYITVFNNLNVLILSIDMYLWLILLYFCGNYRKKKQEV